MIPFNPFLSGEKGREEGEKISTLLPVRKKRKGGKNRRQLLLLSEKGRRRGSPLYASRGRKS